MKKKHVATRLEKSTSILGNARATQWCYVNTENEFNFMNETFVIDGKVEDYKVHNKAGVVEEYTNESYMDSILVIMDTEDKLSFYNQNYDRVENKLVRIKE